MLLKGESDRRSGTLPVSKRNQRNRRRAVLLSIRYINEVGLVGPKASSPTGYLPREESGGVHNLIVAAGAIAVIVGALLLGLSRTTRPRSRDFCLILGWLMVIYGLGAEVAALVQSERSGPVAGSTSP